MIPLMKDQTQQGEAGGHLQMTEMAKMEKQSKVSLHRTHLPSSQRVVEAIFAQQKAQMVLNFHSCLPVRVTDSVDECSYCLDSEKSLFLPMSLSLLLLTAKYYKIIEKCCCILILTNSVFQPFVHTGKIMCTGATSTSISLVKIPAVLPNL